MVTTDNELKPTAGSKAHGVTKEDAKLMLDAYNNGDNISKIALDYGYAEAEVQATVVKEVKE